MSVALDVVGTEVALSLTASTANTAYNSPTHNLTIGSGLTNSAVVFAVVIGSSTAGLTVPTVTCTWNSVSLTQIIVQNSNDTNGTSTGNSWVFLFGLVNPASGAQTFSITSTITCDAYVYGISFQNVNQTGGTTTFAHSAGATAGQAASSSQSVTITNANGDWTMAAGGVGTGNTTNTMQLGGVTTQDWFDNSDPVGAGIFGAAGNASATGTSAVWSIHNSTADVAFLAGVDIVAAGGGADVLMAQSVM